MPNLGRLGQFQVNTANTRPRTRHVAVSVTDFNLGQRSSAPVPASYFLLPNSMVVGRGVELPYKTPIKGMYCSFFFGLGARALFTGAGHIIKYPEFQL